MAGRMAGRSRGFVQEVAASIGNAYVNLLDAGPRLLPVVAELLMDCCALRNRSWCRLKPLSGATNVPSESVAKRMIPLSMPTMLEAGWTGSATWRSVWMLMNHLPPLRDAVTFFTVPSTSRLLR